MSKKSYLQTCSIELGCDETRSLNCSITGDLLYICDCLNGSYWSSSLNNCTTKKLNSLPCSSSNECRTDLGLDCTSSQCQCSSLFYWDSTQCGIIYPLINSSNFLFNFLVKS